MADSTIAFQGHVLTAGDLLATWAVELVVHHHDLNAPRPGAAPGPSAVRIGRLTAQALREDLPEGDDLSVVLAAFVRM